MSGKRTHSQISVNTTEGTSTTATYSSTSGFNTGNSSSGEGTGAGDGGDDPRRNKRPCGHRDDPEPTMEDIFGPETDTDEDAPRTPPRHRSPRTEPAFGDSPPHQWSSPPATPEAGYTELPPPRTPPGRSSPVCPGAPARVPAPSGPVVALDFDPPIPGNPAMQLAPLYPPGIDGDNEDAQPDYYHWEHE